LMVSGGHLTCCVRVGVRVCVHQLVRLQLEWRLETAVGCLARKGKGKGKRKKEAPELHQWEGAITNFFFL